MTTVYGIPYGPPKSGWIRRPLPAPLDDIQAALWEFTGSWETSECQTLLSGSR